MKTSGSFGLRVCAALAAFGFAFTASADIPASAYVQDGLVAHYDAIANAGVKDGVDQHAVALDKWVNLASGASDAVLPASGCTVNAKSMKLENVRAEVTGLSCAQCVTPITLEGSVRIVGKPTSASSTTFVSATGRGGIGYDVRTTRGIAFFEPSSSSWGNQLMNYYWAGNFMYSDAGYADTRHTLSLVSSVTSSKTAYAKNSATPVYFDSVQQKSYGDGWNSGSKAAAPDGSVYIGYNTAVYEINAVRIYNRALTPEEIAINANIDKMRFEGVDPATMTWPEGYRMNAKSGKVECHVQIVSNAENPVSLDGETFAAEVEGWYELGSTITAWCQVAQGRNILRWDGAPHNAVVGLNQIGFAATSCTITPVIHMPVTLRWRGGASVFASALANWVNGDGTPATELPVFGDTVCLDNDSPSMTWDLDDVVLGGWTQTADYTGTVTFQTGISRDKQTAHGVLDVDGQTRILKVSGDVTLNGGKWTHTRNPDTVTATDGKGVYRLIVDAGGDFSLGEGAKIDVSELGFNTRRGPAASDGNCGGGHGGHGGFGNSGSLKVSDSIREPVMIGGAGYYSWYSGSAFILKVAQQTTVDGTIAANAQDSTTWYAAAGGSVFISTGKFAGGANAVISADGGGAPNGMGGGGGRISVLLSDEQADFADFKGTIRAAARKEPSGSNPGTGGTIYLETVADGVNRGTLIVDGLRMDDPKFTSVPAHDVKNATLITGDNLNCRPKKLILRNKAVVGVASGDTWDLSATEIESDVTAGYANTIRLLGGTIVLPEANYTNVSFASCVAGSSIQMGNGSGVLKLCSGSTATFDSPLSIAGSLEVLSGGAVTHTANSGSQSYSIDLTVGGDVTVRAGGTISARGKGYSSNNGPGKANQGSGNRGASHGGIANKETGDICYGSPTRPTTIGSGGMSNRGGGAVKLTVAGTLVNDGSIDADGPSGSYHVGSGGSVWLTAARMSGNGTVSATGGHVTGYNTGGGGGRVALWLTDPTADFTNLDQTKVNAFGGDDSGKIYSAAGTVYFKTGAQAADEGTLVIANSNSTLATTWTEIGSDMETVRVGSVVIRDKGRLKLRSGHNLEVGGDWLNNGSFLCETNASVVLFSTREATIVGTNSFYNFSCAVGDKTLKMGTAASLFSILPGGKLVWTGEEGRPLTVEGDADAPWLMAGAADSDFSSLSYLVVSNSDASAVAQLLAAGNSVDAGGNSENWSFSNVRPGDPIVWTGKANMMWSDPTNWDPPRAPIETDAVTIPKSCERNPTLSTSLTLYRLTVEGLLGLNGCDLTMTDKLAVSGALVANGGESVSTGGDIEFTGSLVGELGALELTGDAAQVMTLGECNPRRLVVAKSGGSVAWAGDLSADVLSCAVTAPLMMTFAAGKTVTLKELRMDGAIGAAVGLILAASGEGQWKLKVSDSERVSGVAVANCDATGGLVIHGDAPYGDNGNNANWVFGSAAAIWRGGASGDFMTAANWSTGQVPGKDDRVIIDTGAVTLGEAVEIAQLTVGGGETAASLKVTAELTVGGGVDIRNGGTLSLNVPSTVGGSLFVRNGGTLTHEANSDAETYKLDLTVTENMTVEAGGAIEVTGKGYAGYRGPGYADGNSASSYGGRGANGNQPDKVKPCYGSILCPFRLGSGGMRDAYVVTSSGGGAVKLTVGGTLTVDGGVVADGQHSGQQYYSATGGSIWLTASRLIGAGVIRANGTPVTGFCPGAGGRVALYQTEATDLSASQVTLQARGGYLDTGSTTDYRPHAAGGTIYVKNAGDKFGTVILEDGNGVEKDLSDTLPFATDIPVTVDGDPVKAYKEMNFEVSAGGVLSLTADCTINDLVLGTNGKLRLNDHTLTIRTRTHLRGRGWSETSVIDRGSGQTGRIVWNNAGLCILVR